MVLVLVLQNCLFCGVRVEHCFCTVISLRLNCGGVLLLIFQNNGKL